MITFLVKEARSHLEEYGIVYTLREFSNRRVGKCKYNYFPNDRSRGSVFIVFIGNFFDKECELVPYVKDSGFNSLNEWLEKAGKARMLYSVSLL